MKIIKEGSVPPPAAYTTTCNKCKCVFKWNVEDKDVSNHSYSLFDTSRYVVSCPTERCENMFVYDGKDNKNLILSGNSHDFWSKRQINL